MTNNSGLATESVRFNKAGVVAPRHYSGILNVLAEEVPGPAYSADRPCLEWMSSKAMDENNASLN
jgi:hypothetical protein